MISKRKANQKKPVQGAFLKRQKHTTGTYREEARDVHFL